MLHITIDGALKNGDTGRDVYVLQALLAYHGYPSGGIDGIFGAGTEAEVREFQYQHALEVDGIAGPATFRELCG